MPIINTEDWERVVKTNNDPYGKACVDVARRVMELLDNPDLVEIDSHALVWRADKEVNVGGITGFMAGCVAQMVAQYHSRGKEFNKEWNKHYGFDENEKGTVNPAILTLNV